MRPGTSLQVSALLIVLGLALCDRGWTAPTPSPSPSVSAEEEKISQEVYEHYKSGNALFESAHFKEAAAEFEKVLKLSPQHVGSLYMLGLCQMTLKDYAHAEETFKKVTSVNARYTDAYMQLANVYVATGRYDLARDQMAILEKAGDKTFLVPYVKGVISYQQGRLDEAIIDWERSYKLYDDYAPCLYNLGWAYYQQRNSGRALVDIRKAVLISPRRTLYQFGLGYVAYATGDGAIGGRAFNVVKSVGLDDEFALAVRCFEAIRNKDAAEAVKQGQACVAKNPGFSTGWLLLGLAQQMKGNLRAAHEAADQAIKADGLSFEAKEFKAKLSPAPPEPSPAPASPKPSPASPGVTSSPAPGASASPSPGASPSPSPGASASPSPRPGTSESTKPKQAP